MSLAPPAPPRPTRPTWMIPTIAVLVVSLIAAVIALAISLAGDETADVAVPTAAIAATAQDAIARCQNSIDAGTCTCIVESMAGAVGVEGLEATLDDPLGVGIANEAFLSAVVLCTPGSGSITSDQSTTSQPETGGVVAAPDTAPPTSPVSSLAGTQCRNSTFAFTIAVPDGWEAYDGDTPEQACRFVAPLGDPAPTIIVEAVTGATYGEMFQSITTSSQNYTALWNEEFTLSRGGNAFAAVEEISAGGLTGTQQIHVVTDTRVPIWFFVQIQPPDLPSVGDYNAVMVDLAHSLIVD